MEVPGVLKKYSVEILGVNWKRSGISWSDQEKFTLNFHESWLLALEFPRGVTQVYGISKGRALICPDYSRVKEQT